MSFSTCLEEGGGGEEGEAEAFNLEKVTLFLTFLPISFCMKILSLFFG
jgi:hypothetical protein